MTVQTVMHDLESRLEAARAEVARLRADVQVARDALKDERNHKDYLRRRIVELESALGEVHEREHRELVELMDPGDGRVFVESARAEVA